MSHKIITIARQFGSGGHEVAQRLSDQLGIPLYDRNLVEMAAERMGHSPVSIEKADESALSSFLAGYQIPKEPNSVTGYGLSLNDSTYVTQTIIIEALAQKGPCVIVGRCADYILQDTADCLKVFIHADLAFRAHRIVEVYGQREQSPEERLRDKDKRRAAYHRFYTNMKWGHAQNYHLTLDSGVLGIDKCVEIIAELY